MAIGVTDGGAWATAAGASVTSVTSNTFNAASGDLVIVCAVGDDNGTGAAEQPFSDTLTDNITPDQTWTVITSSAASGTCFSKAWRAIASTTITNGTVTASRAGIGNSSAAIIAVKIYVVTGHHATTPIGNVWNTSNTSTTNNWTPNTYTSSANNSRGFAIAGDWSALGAPTSSDTESSGHDGSSMSWMSSFKAADTPTSGTAVAFNFDAATGTPDWRAIAWEVVPAAGAAATPKGVFGRPLHGPFGGPI